MGVEERRVVEKRVEWNSYSPPCLDIFKINKGKRVISPSSCLNVLKMRRERRGNDLNRQIYPYFKNGLAILVYD